MMSIARAAGHPTEAYQLALELMQDSETPPETLLEISGMFVGDRRLDLFAYAMEAYLKRRPNDAGGWVDLGAAYAQLRRPEEGLRAAKKAVETGGISALRALFEDARYRPMAEYAPFTDWLNRQIRTSNSSLGPRLAPGALSDALGGGAALPGLR